MLLFSVKFRPKSEIVIELPRWSAEDLEKLVDGTPTKSHDEKTRVSSKTLSDRLVAVPEAVQVY